MTITSSSGCCLVILQCSCGRRHHWVTGSGLGIELLATLHWSDHYSYNNSFPFHFIADKLTPSPSIIMYLRGSLCTSLYGLGPVAVHALTATQYSSSACRSANVYLLSFTSIRMIFALSSDDGHLIDVTGTIR